MPSESHPLRRFNVQRGSAAKIDQWSTWPADIRPCTAGGSRRTAAGRPCGLRSRATRIAGPGHGHDLHGGRATVAAGCCARRRRSRGGRRAARRRPAPVGLERCGRTGAHQRFPHHGLAADLAAAARGPARISGREPCVGWRIRRHRGTAGAGLGIRRRCGRRCAGTLAASARCIAREGRPAASGIARTAAGAAQGRARTHARSRRHRARLGGRSHRRAPRWRWACPITSSNSAARCGRAAAALQVGPGASRSSGPCPASAGRWA